MGLARPRQPREQDKIGEAREFARQAYEGGQRALGPDNPDVKAYEKLWQELNTSQKPNEKK